MTPVSPSTDGIDFALLNVPPGAVGIAGFAYDGYAQTEIAHVRVAITGPAGNAELVTDERGDYVTDELPTGEYVIEFSADGYQDGMLPDPVVVEDRVIAAFTELALYPLTGVAERPAEPAAGRFIRVEPSLGRGTRISWQARQAGPAEVQVVDKTGRLVRTLVSGTSRVGVHSAHWNGRDEMGVRVAEGVYFCRVTDATGSDIAKVVLVGR